MAGITITDVELAEHGPAMKRECVAWFKEPITGGVISEGIFNLVPFSPKTNQITAPQLFNL